jgi:hypothetical protein
MPDTDTSPNLGLPFYQTKLNEFEVQHNEALLMLDALVMLAVIDRDLSAPPSSPSPGDRYLVKPAGTGDFAGKDNRVAQYDVGGWNFYAPRVGWTCYVEDEHALLAWNGTSWTAALDALGGITELQNLSLLGVGTTADGSNPLSAKLNNVLWTAKTVAEGGDGTLRYKLNKENAAATLSLLLQNNYSGRAEIGLTGDDDLHFKTSPDGSAWIDALTLNKTTGAAKLNSALLLTGDISPSQITADQHDYNPAGLAQAAVLRLSTDASRNVTGLAGGADGRIAAIVNAGTNAIVLKDANTGSSAANRFSFGADVTLAAKQCAVLWYDATDSRWKLLAGPQAATSGGSVPADLDLMLAELAVGLADALNSARFLGSAGNRFADSFDTFSHVDSAGSTNLETGVPGSIRPTVAPTQIAQATGTAIGDMIANGGLAAAFDGVTNQSTTAGATKNPTSGSSYVGKNYSAAPQKIAKAIVYGSNGSGFFNIDAPIVLALYGKNGSAPATYNDGIVLGSITFTDTGNESAGRTLVSNDMATLWDYVWVAVYRTDFLSGGAFVAELELYSPGATNNMTAKSVALTAAAAPASMKVVARAKFIDAITLGTDYKFSVSRDGGTTWSYGTMTDRFTVNAIHVLESAAIDVSGQPSGTSVKWRIETANNKLVETHDIYTYWT